MDRKYWEKIAPDYNEEIFDVLKNDKKNIIRSAIIKRASPAKTVADIGCAVGKWLPVLAPAFKQVIAVDISIKNLGIAQKNHPQYNNVDYIRADMSAGKTKLPKCDMAICINAILTDSVKKRDNFFKNLSRIVKKGGYLVLVVPSLESWMMTHIIQNKWKIDEALFAAKFSAKAGSKKYRNLLQGHADIDQVPTKHYLREELDLILSLQGFSIETIQKIEYNWKTEFVKPPKWLKRPNPWDWMLAAKKME
jgi:2-polyprenyl-3-methyl-5-hydroxy-6-metoxy-1,4-benzoquinol methylase